MKYFLIYLTILCSHLQAEEWLELLDPDLSKWETFIGVPHKTVEVPGMERTDNEDGITGVPLGLGNDPLTVFSMIEEEGRPVLRVTGQIYGGLSTKEEFSNYHLSLQFRWGDKKWPPRMNAKRDSGILFHCVGKQGASWNVWMRSLECQIQEGDCGDYIPVSGASAHVPLLLTPGNNPKYQEGAPLYAGCGYADHGPSEEKPKGEWNTIEVFTIGQTAVFVINGKPNMVIFDTSQKKPNGTGHAPLTKGKIQIQAEGAELYYREIKIKQIKKFPEHLTKLTQHPGGEIKVLP